MSGAHRTPALASGVSGQPVSQTLLSIIQYLQSVPNPRDALRQNALTFCLALGLPINPEDENLSTPLEALLQQVMGPHFFDSILAPSQSPLMLMHPHQHPIQVASPPPRHGPVGFPGIEDAYAQNMHMPPPPPPPPPLPPPQIGASSPLRFADMTTAGPTMIAAAVGQTPNSPFITTSVPVVSGTAPSSELTPSQLGMTPAGATLQMGLFGPPPPPPSATTDPTSPGFVKYEPTTMVAAAAAGLGLHNHEIRRSPSSSRAPHAPAPPSQQPQQSCRCVRQHTQCCCYRPGTSPTRSPSGGAMACGAAVGVILSTTTTTTAAATGGGGSASTHPGNVVSLRSEWQQQSPPAAPLLNGRQCLQQLEQECALPPTIGGGGSAPGQSHHHDRTMSASSFHIGISPTPVSSPHVLAETTTPPHPSQPAAAPRSLDDEPVPPKAAATSTTTKGTRRQRVPRIVLCFDQLVDALTFEERIDVMKGLTTCGTALSEVYQQIEVSV